MEEKNIDRVFQEKLKDLEINPKVNVWIGIEKKLKKKKKNHVFHLGWFLGKIAALLILSLVLYPSKKSTKDVNNTDVNIIVESSDSNTDKKKTKMLVVQEETKKKKTLEVKPNKNEILTAKHVVKTSKVKLQEKNIDNKATRIIKENLLASNNIIKENSTEKLENSLLFIKKKNDTIYLVEKLKKDFLEVVNGEEDINENEKRKVWSVSSSLAVLNSNSFSKSSPIDASLSNSTIGVTSYSYGIEIAYQLNKKWTLQSGVHLLEIGYSNKNVAVNPVKSSSANIAFSTGESYTLNDISTTGFNLNSISISSGSLDGELNQSYGYIEVPIEIKYSVIEGKKLKAQLVAGFSSLFLNKNKVDLKTTTFSTSGEANNLNNINFSGNIGVDLSYKLSKKWSLNINPMLKTQINTFKNNSNSFKPYFLGVYTGINYQF